MSGSVSIDIDALQGAISALTGLAGRIDTQRNQVVSGTPCSLPSLSAGTIGAVSSWLTDQEPELSTRLDLARLLATEGANVVTYTTDADTLANVQEMLGHEMAERVNDVSYDTEAEDLEDLNEILGRRRVYDHDGHGVRCTRTSSPRARRGRSSMLESNAHVRRRRRRPDRPRQDPSARAGHGQRGAQLLRPRPTGSELVRWFVAPMHTEDEQDWMSEHDMSGMNGCLVDVLHDARRQLLPPSSSPAPPSTLDEFEQLSAGRRLGDAQSGTPTTATATSTRATRSPYADPMAEMMRAMSRQPEVGYDFITGEDRADFYFNERDWSHDGYDGIAALADRVSTDPDVYAAHPAGAAMVASQFVDWTAELGRLQPRGRRRRPPTASDTCSRPTCRRWRAAWTGVGDGRQPEAALAATRSCAGFGEIENMPQFFRRRPGAT